MKKTISIQIPDEKLSAIEMYLEQKNTTLAAELDKQLEQIYAKVVPQNVREYIDMMIKQPRRKPRKSDDGADSHEQ